MALRHELADITQLLRRIVSNTDDINAAINTLTSDNSILLAAQATLKQLATQASAALDATDPNDVDPAVVAKLIAIVQQMHQTIAGTAGVSTANQPTPEPPVTSQPVDPTMATDPTTTPAAPAPVTVTSQPVDPTMATTPPAPVTTAPTGDTGTTPAAPADGTADGETTDGSDGTADAGSADSAPTAAVGSDAGLAGADSITGVGDQAAVPADTVLPSTPIDAGDSGASA